MGENVVKIECDNLKTEYEVKSFSCSAGNSAGGGGAAKEIKEKSQEGLLTESDDENIPLVSIIKMESCRKRKILKVKNIQCGK